MWGILDDFSYNFNGLKNTENFSEFFLHCWSQINARAWGKLWQQYKEEKQFQYLKEQVWGTRGS
jgi:hypothetical protein